MAVQGFNQRRLIADLCLFAGVTLLREEGPKVITEDDEKDGDKIAV